MSNRELPTYQNDPGLALIYFFGKNEYTSGHRMLSLARREKPHAVSMKIGHACKQYVTEGVEPDYQFTSANNQLTRMAKAAKDKQSDNYKRGHQLQLTLQQLSSYGEPLQFAQQKASLKQAAGSELQTNLNYDTDLQALQPWTELQVVQHHKYRGTITELAFLAVGAYQPEAEHIITLALQHHDNHPEPSKAFDLLLTNLRAEQMPAYYRLQFKAGCIGACIQNTDRGEKLKGYKAMYAPNIRLLSGHCDLGLPHDDDVSDGEDRYLLPRLLAKEALETPSPIEAATLHDITAAVLDRMVSDDSRRGTAGPYMTYEESIAA